MILELILLYGAYKVVSAPEFHAWLANRSRIKAMNDELEAADECRERRAAARTGERQAHAEMMNTLTRTSEELRREQKKAMRAMGRASRRR